MKKNVLIVGVSGAGKSTLVNAIAGQTVAKVTKGDAATQEITTYKNDSLDFNIVDTRGFEFNVWNQNKIMKSLSKLIKKGLGTEDDEKEESEVISCIWYCVEATNGRLHKENIKSLLKLTKPWKDVPVIVVLTKSYAKPQNAENIKMVQEQFDKYGKRKEEALAEGNLRKAKTNNTKQKTIETKLAKERELWEEKKSVSRITVTENDVAAVVSSWTKIPVTRISQSESQRLLGLEDTLKKRVIGQDEAVTMLAKAIKRGRVGLKDPKRPIGSFMFLGPTGVGKTELSKALAEALFGDENAMIRVDMSEYMEKHSVSKLIGSPPGYVGYEEGGQLSEQVRRHPYSVLLFDEIEKAHGDVFNILLQVLDDGQITDSNGRKVDFKNTVIIMTSNAGAQRIMAPKNLGFITERSAKEDHERMKSQVMEEVKQLFKPEFINRVDGIMVFHTLEKPQQKEIVKLLLKELSDRLSKNPGFVLNFSDKVADYVLEKGYDPQYGARPLRRAIQNELEDFLADEYLEGHIKNNDKILLDIEKDKPVIQKERKKKKTE